ncbi:MAG: histidine phosphatase family protein, partial [Candidatus Wildermuthbacteria bacterium]|nr:histidine phosphatase family protein [Candidatus Wildermuthbacteria bacterium]
MINEAKISSGWKDVELSELGIRQAKELRSKMLSRAEAEKLIEDTEPRRSKEIKIDLVCCSDLKRAIDTVKIAFGNKYPIIIDKRLRECDYGDFTGKPSEIVDSIRKEKIKESFPNGESYEQAVARIQDFYLELK